MKTDLENDAKKFTLSWRLHAVMADRGIKFAKELKDGLEKNGVLISVSSVSRLVYKQPKQMDIALLEGLCQVLGCTPNDLFMTKVG